MCLDALLCAQALADTTAEALAMADRFIRTTLILQAGLQSSNDLLSDFVLNPECLRTDDQASADLCCCSRLHGGRWRRAHLAVLAGEC